METKLYKQINTIWSEFENDVIRIEAYGQEYFVDANDVLAIQLLVARGEIEPSDIVGLPLNGRGVFTEPLGLKTFQDKVVDEIISELLKNK